jgi:hypothetical protein
MSGMRHAAGCVSGVSFMDCAGLRALLTTRRRAELHGGFLRLIAVPRAVRPVIELTRAHEPPWSWRGATDRLVGFFLPNGPDATSRQKWIARPEEAETP